MKRWCTWCGEELKFDSRQGWVHQDGTRRDDHNAMPIGNDWKAAQRREEAGASGLAGKFAEALGCLEDALGWLGKVNEQYDLEQYPLVDYGLWPRNPGMDFWLQAELAEERIKGILRRLQRVEPLAPKEKEGTK